MRAAWPTALAARLRARGDRCTLVRAGDAYAMSGDEAVIRPGVAADYRRLLDRSAHSRPHACTARCTPGRWTLLRGSA